MKSGYELTKELLKAARTSLRSPYDELARRLGRSRSYLEKIVQESPSDDNPHADGIPNPIDQTDAVFEFALHYAPEYAELIVAHFAERLRQHKALQQRFFAPTQGEVNDQIQRFFKEQSDVFTAIACKATPDEYRRQWAEAQVQFDELVSMVEAQHLQPETKISQFRR